MKKTLIKILTILLVLFVTISIIFLLMHAIGDGPSIINSSSVDQSVKDSFNSKYGLDKPIYIQLLLFWKNLFTGSLGVSLSIHLGSEINSFIWPKFFTSLLIGGLGVIFGTFLGVFFGIAIGMRLHKRFDKFSQIIISFFIALPSFILALIFIFIASAAGWKFIFDRYNPLTWILPILSISIPVIMSTAKFMRTRILTSKDQLYAKLAKSKGVSNRGVVLVHLIKETMFTIVTALPATVIGSVVSSILVENIFSIPGLGRVYTQAIQTKDYNVVLAITTLMVVLVSLSFILRDFLYSVLDPRTKMKGGV